VARRLGATVDAEVAMFGEAVELWVTERGRWRDQSRIG